jgi:anti-anti-sigma factor
VAGQPEFAILQSGTNWVVEGELDASTAALVTAAVSTEADSGGTLRLDLSGVTFIDSSGLGVLVDLSRQVSERGGSVQIDDPSSSVARLLEITKMTDLFGVG